MVGPAADGEMARTHLGIRGLLSEHVKMCSDKKRNGGLVVRANLAVPFFNAGECGRPAVVK